MLYEQIDAKKTARCTRMLAVTISFYIAVNDFDAKKPRMLVVTETRKQDQVTLVEGDITNSNNY